MKKRIPIRVAMATLLATVLLSCHRETEIAPAGLKPGSSINQDIQAHYAFDWEGPASNPTTTMPVSNSSPTVYVPWRSNGGVPLDPGIVEDYHQKDGWELVYNTFAPDNYPTNGTTGTVATSGGQPSGGLYFALYNRFRGILRYYLYLPPGLYNGNSTQITHGLQVYSSSTTSRMLNFEGTDIVDPTSHTTGFSKTNKDGISTTGGWYAMQYQIAYDPAFQTTTYPSPGFRWDATSIGISQIKLNGVETGTTKGTITTPKPDFDWTTTITNGVLGVAEIFTGNILSGAKGEMTALQQAAQGGLAGNTTGFFSGLFGGNSANSQTVDLTMNSTITTNGTSTSSQTYEANAMPFPGQSAGSNGVPPLISHAIGVFNLSARPKVYVYVTNSPSTTFTDPSYTHYEYTSDVNDVQNLFQPNPTLFNGTATGAQYSNFKVETIIPEPGTSDMGWSVGGTREIIGAGVYYSAYPSVEVEYQSTGPQLGPPPGPAFVRVSFNVKANDPNGPQNILIVKTFAADIVQ